MAVTLDNCRDNVPLHKAAREITRLRTFTDSSIPESQHALSLLRRPDRELSKATLLSYLLARWKDQINDRGQSAKTHLVVLALSQHIGVAEE